jgi:hypothetical protein
LTRALLLALGAATLAACDPTTPTPAACPDDAPTACPSPMPSFTADVAPIVASRCVKCHNPTGMAKNVPFQTFDQVHAQATSGAILMQIELCAMPKPPEAPLEPAQRQALMGWAICGGPDN